MDAVIDIGSNSVRLMLSYDGLSGEKQLLSTTLADGLAKTGVLDSAAMKRTLDAVVGFCGIAWDKGADNIFIFGTEAMRSAKNGESFRLAIEKATGEAVDVITGETEAWLAFLGAREFCTSELTVIDIGGASVEIVAGDRHRLTYLSSLPLGAVRLIDTAGEAQKDIENYVYSRISEFGHVSGDECVAIGGTATALAAMDLKLEKYDPFLVHGHTLSISALDRLIGRIFASTDRRADFPTLSLPRARVIGHGAIVLKAALEHLGAERVTVSEHDNLEGYLALKLGNI